jgi:hypothetical protein
MAQTEKASQSRLRPPRKVLEKALKDSADRARRMAEAFGLKVPGVAPKPEIERLTSVSGLSGKK